MGVSGETPRSFSVFLLLHTRPVSLSERYTHYNTQHTRVHDTQTVEKHSSEHARPLWTDRGLCACRVWVCARAHTPCRCRRVRMRVRDHCRRAPRARHAPGAHARASSIASRSQAWRGNLPCPKRGQEEAGAMPRCRANVLATSASLRSSRAAIASFGPQTWFTEGHQQTHKRNPASHRSRTTSSGARATCGRRSDQSRHPRTTLPSQSHLSALIPSSPLLLSLTLSFPSSP